MTDSDRESNSEIPSNERLRADEQLPTKVLPSDYVVVTDAAQIEKDRRAKPSNGPIKPDHLKDEYVVVPPTSIPVTAPLGDPMHSTGTIPVASANTASANTASATAPSDYLPAGYVPSEPGATETKQIVYVTAPVPPKPKSNRGFGLLIALLATVLFAVLFAFAVLLIIRAVTGSATMTVLANPGYWLPVTFFLVSFALVVLIANRAGWWAYIIGSAVIGLAVYLGSTAIIVLIEFYVRGNTVDYQVALVQPNAIIAGLLAREIALWSGAIIGRRGRGVKTRNLEARTAFDREQVEAAAAR
jgi:hypothetical protein